MIQTNRIEGFWTWVKAAIIATYRGVSPKHLQRYADEIAFRYNTIHSTTEERLSLILKSNNRITYKMLVHGK